MDLLNNRYRFLSQLEQGGVVTTHEALDIQNNQKVIIKSLSVDQMGKDWKPLELFEREVRILASLNHPQIAKYLDFFETEGSRNKQFCFIQEKIEGSSFAHLIESQSWRITEKDAREIAKSILSILKYLHSLTPPVIHRDIKPQNLILREDGVVCLVDFGAVQERYNTTVAKATSIGTWGFMPMEQVFGKSYPASDLYSLGATLVYLVTGQTPSDLLGSRNRIEFRHKAQVSENFAKWLDNMIEPAMEDRFESAQDALDSLERIDQKTPQQVFVLQTFFDKLSIFNISKDLKKNKRILLLFLIGLGIFFFIWQIYQMENTDNQMIVQELPKGEFKLPLHDPNEKKIPIKSLFPPAFHNHSQFTIVLQELEKIIQETPEIKNAYESARKHFELGQLQEAQKHFQEIIDSHPDIPEITMSRGIQALREKDLDRALLWFFITLQMVPNNPDIYNNIGIIHAMKGNSVASKQSFLEALRINPDHQKAENNLKALEKRWKKLP